MVKELIDVVRQSAGVFRTAAAVLSAGLIGAGMLFTGLYGETFRQTYGAPVSQKSATQEAGGYPQLSTYEEFPGLTRIPLLSEEEEALEAFEYSLTEKYPNLASEFIESLADCYPGESLAGENQEICFYLQTDERCADKPFGEDPIGIYGCGPSAMAIVVSTLTELTIDPVRMAQWAYENGYWARQSGSYHTLIAGAAKAFSLDCESCPREDTDAMKKALEEGSLIVVLMGKGQFTDSGHFIVLYGLTGEGKVLLADPNSMERTNQEWDLETITKEAKSYAADGGPFWIISRQQ